MKITKVKVTSRFRSLPKDFEIKFDENEPSEKAINPICFVGKNGTGKSNVIEFLCEIFYYLETLHLPFYESGKQFKLGFELEYFKYDFSGEKTKVLLKKQSNHNYPTLTYIENETETTIERKAFTSKEAKDTLKRLLPHQVIGYSSGLNELVSNPFIRMQFNYFYNYRKSLEEGYSEIGGGSRLSFMDYDSNALVLLANYLIQDEDTKRKLKTVNDKIEVEGIDSFRLVLRYEGYEIHRGNQTIESNSIIRPYQKSIANLQKCATSYSITNTYQTIKGKSEDQLKADSDLPEAIITGVLPFNAKETRVNYRTWIFDFKVNEATKSAFKHYFGSSRKLYQFLQELQTLNINTFTNEQIEMVRKADKDFNISSYLPKKSNDELLFYADKLQLKKTGSDEPIAYNGLSDGEHQFLHIIGTTLLMDEPGTIFFLDEPETHYNPRWRAKLVSTLNDIAGEHNRQQMFVITTHSPFILSDCHQQNVFKFNRDDNGLPRADVITTKTYGASFDILLNEAFDYEHTVSETVKRFIEEQYKKPMDSLEAIQTIKSRIRPLAESLEKIMLLEFLNRKRKALKK